VGKSSFINKVIGEERLVVSDIPGTTRDSVDTPFSFKGREYLLIDTAGIRRKSRVKDKLEKFSVIKALNSLERCHVAVIMIDATEGATDQDAHLCGYAFEQAKGIVIVVNKWDLIKRDQGKMRLMMDSLERRLKFVSYAPRINVSALTGENIEQVFEKINLVYDQMNKRIKTSFVNKVLQEIVQTYPPPMKGRKRAKLFYGTQVDTMPPTFVIFVNNPELISLEYKRFLMNQFRTKFELENSPIKLIFKERPRKS
jgi:GTP-binding protein